MRYHGVQVLKYAEENKALIRVDPLQKLHTLSNLAALLADGLPEGVPRTLRDDSLQPEAESIREVDPLVLSYLLLMTCRAPRLMLSILHAEYAASGHTHHQMCMRRSLSKSLLIGCSN